MNHQGMKFSLISRELIADSIETVVRAHCYDGLVGLAGCDKTLPGVMMAMVRCNVPAVFLYGGSAPPGRWAGRDVTVLDCYEAVGAVLAGAMTQEELAPAGTPLPAQYWCVCWPVPIPWPWCQALGLALPGSAMVPAVYAERHILAERTGETVMQLLHNRDRCRIW